MSTHHTVEVPAGGAEVPEEMMAELKKEIERNLEATKLVKQREMEATSARDRAADSHRRMQDMMVKYDEMKKKLEWTRLTLAETHSRLEHHNSARSERIKQSVSQLKEKADFCTQRLNKRNAEQQSGAEALPGEPPVVEDAGGLTDAERMLLQLCQEQRQKDIDASNAEPEIPVIEPVKPPSKDYAKTVLDLQMKLSSAKTQKPTEPDRPVSPVEPSQDHEPAKEPATVEVPPVDDELTLQQPEVVDMPPIEVAQAPVPPKALAPVEDVAIEEITMDLNETVTKMEAKCAGVREELGQMAMSEQYMRTKQAQLLAKRREKEAQLALEIAAKKEHEAQAMRKKVTDMMRLLEERKNKLKMTEVRLEKKSVVVEKVNNILDKKVRRANLVEQQRDEVLAFETNQKQN